MTNPTMAAFDRLVAELRSIVETAISERDAQAKRLQGYAAEVVHWKHSQDILLRRIAELQRQGAAVIPADAADQYLQEVADGAWGDGPHLRGLARDELNRRAPATREWIGCKVCGGAGKTIHKHAGSAFGLAADARICGACNGTGGHEAAAGDTDG